MDRLDGLVRTLARRHIHADLVPHPLAGGGEVEELAGHRKAVEEPGPPPGRMSLVRSVARLQQRGAEEPDIDDLACHAVDLHPVALADPIAAHQHKPAEERQDEVLKDHRQSRHTQSQDGRHLAGRAEDEQQHQHQRHPLDSQAGNRAQCMYASRVHNGAVHGAVQQGLHQPPHQHRTQQQRRNSRHRLQDQVQHNPVLRVDLRNPLRIHRGELLVRVQPVFQNRVDLCQFMHVRHSRQLALRVGAAHRCIRLRSAVGRRARILIPDRRRRRCRLLMQRRVLRCQRRGVRLRLRLRLLDRILPASLIEPPANPPGQRSIPLHRDRRWLARVVGL